MTTNRPDLDTAHWEARFAELVEKHGIPGAQLGILRLGADGGADEVFTTATGVLPVRHDPDGPCQRRAETDRLGIRAVGLLKDQAAHALRPGRRRRQAGLSQRVQSRRRPGPG